MQILYAIVQLRSNMQLKNDSLHYNHDLEANWVQVMNTKVVPYDILNMFKVPLRFHKHFIHWSHVTLAYVKHLVTNTCDINNHKDKFEMLMLMNDQ